MRSQGAEMKEVQTKKKEAAYELVEDGAKYGLMPCTKKSDCNENGPGVKTFCHYNGHSHGWCLKQKIANGGYCLSSASCQSGICEKGVLYPVKHLMGWRKCV